MSKKYDDPNTYPNDIRPIVMVLLKHEEEVTWGNDYLNDPEEADDQQAARDMLTTIAYEILTATKTMLSDQYPLWELKNGQFVPTNRQNKSRTVR